MDKSPSQNRPNGAPEAERAGRSRTGVKPGSQEGRNQAVRPGDAESPRPLGIGVKANGCLASEQPAYIPRKSAASNGRRGPVELSFVIPVYNSSDSAATVVRRVLQVFPRESCEVILVNDGSSDASEAVCRALADQYRGVVCMVQLTRNFGEHHAVLAGLQQARGEYIAVLDDDGQNPPEEIPRMLAELKARNLDVCYGHYRQMRQSAFRALGSRFNDRMANLVLGKPREIYLSSFKVMTRFLAQQLVRYRGPFPYIDGLIYRVTRSIGQVPVEHRERRQGHSGYTLRKLVGLWANMFLGYSVLPLRLTVLGGLVASALSGILLLSIIVEKLWVHPDIAVGIPSILVGIAFFAGVQLVVLGMIGEYVGRIFLELTGMPQHAVRYIHSHSRCEPREDETRRFPTGPVEEEGSGTSDCWESAEERQP